MIPIKNVYYMLTYAFSILRGQDYKKLSTEEFQNTADLMSAILVKAITIQLKRGLEKKYIPETEEILTLRGKVEISESLKGHSYFRKRMVCSYEEFSVDNIMNRIIKSTLHLLLKSDIPKKRKKELRKILVFFNEIDIIDLNKINWNFQYNKNNQSYRMIISICYLVVNGLLQTTSDGQMKLMDFINEQQMNRLYEKFILEYYKKHYPKLKVNASQIPWALDDGIGDMLPIMQSDIQLQKENNVLIIDAKYYSSTTQVRFDKHTIHSNNLYQIFTYVKNRQYQFGDNKCIVSGMLLYAKTNEQIQPDNLYQFHGNQISVRTLDLNLSFKEIEEQLDAIIYSHFEHTLKK